jgi:hypothetical protein
MRQALEKTLRSVLERTVIKARDIAEQAVREAIERLGTGEITAPGYLTEAETKLRVQLRAHGRHLGDVKLENGEQEIDLLISEAAYEHWHRMLFARFLEQNSLLMYDASTHVTLEECGELAADEGFANGWAYASHLASKMLPQVFRQDSAVLQLELTLEHVRKLEQLIEALDPETFQAQDSLGWVYQFWQTKRKQQVNDSEVKIGAKELSPVTQLFTEPYMVSFLLDNALGAWWANRTLTTNDIETAKTEQDLRERASIPGVPLNYLRFVQNTNESNKTGESEHAVQSWQPAAGKFEQWPQHLSELKTLDPCCGSGHFLVAAFSMLVPMRMADEGLNAKDAVNLVLSQNIHGLELDQRCVELAAFALALEAWRYPGAGGFRTLPELHLACSGLSIKAAKAEWKELGIKLNDETGKKNLSIALDWMHKTFSDAPVLGSLINPRKSDAAKIVQWDELESALNQALAINADDDGALESQEQHEAGIVAQGMAKAASLLAGQYSWVITNVPYLARGKQSDTLKNFCEKNYHEGKNDLATVFLDRCLELCEEGGTSSIVLPQNWLFLTSYKKFREKLLKKDTWNIIARLGAKGFQTPMWDFNVQLISISRGQNGFSDTVLENSENKGEHYLHGVDVAAYKSAEEKLATLPDVEVKTVKQNKQLENPSSSIVLDNIENQALVRLVAQPFKGLGTGDDYRYRRKSWEIKNISDKWIQFRSSPGRTVTWGTGNTDLLFFNSSKQSVSRSSSAYLRNTDRWLDVGLSFGMMANLPCTIYTGSAWDTTSCTLIPKDAAHLTALWCYAESGSLAKNIRVINQKLSVEVNHFGQVQFDLAHWAKVAEEKYPNGLPQPYTNDPTQWIFHGHPCGSVIWHDQDKRTAMGDLRKDDTVLQTALARLLGYQWPAESDAEMELSEEQRQWVNACESLNALMDDDGIACIPAIRGEKPAADRLEAMLQASYGDAWNINVLNELLASVKASSLEAWLRDKFFDQHSKMFGHRPFIWQVWDGLKDGFSALVNYHQLDADNLDRLIYTYLGDWIRSQEQGVKDGVDGADIRLAAAQNLKAELEAIKQGEAASDGKAGYDIFVRWKPTHEQPMGWNPDLNDGVRLNIRPFMTAKDMGKKGAGILRGKPNVHWKKDRGTDVESAPWYNLGEQYGEKLGSRINDHHLTLAEKQAARDTFKEQQDYIAKAGGVSESENPQGSLV